MQSANSLTRVNPKLLMLVLPFVILPTSVNLLAAASGNFGGWLPCWWPPETTPLTPYGDKKAENSTFSTPILP